MNRFSASIGVLLPENTDWAFLHLFELKNPSRILPTCGALTLPLPAAPVLRSAAWAGSKEKPPNTYQQGLWNKSNKTHVQVGHLAVSWNGHRLPSQSRTSRAFTS